MKLDELKNKSILILGFGKEGRDTLKFLKKIFPRKKIGVADQKQGKNYLDSLKDYDVVIKSPGVPFKILSKSSLKKIITQTDIFFDNCPGTIVGITGTKGKSTTTSLIYKILKEGGVRAHLVGNIGKPVLNLLLSATPKDVYVYELSSHQLYNLRKSPHVAVLLNIYPEHLDYYNSFNEYLRAKQNITRYQKKEDYFIYNSAHPLVKKTAAITKAKKVPIPANYEFVKNVRIPLVGRFNLQNVMAAVTVGRIFGISDKNILNAVKNFKPLPHRLEYVGQYRGIKFYDDALSTIPQTAMAAIDALGDNVQTIMLGGFDRKIDFKDLAKRVLKSKIKNAILFPTTGEKIWKEIVKASRGRGLPRHFFVDNMPDAVKIAYENTQKGKICLLSTASTSFSIFRDYKEKGDLFKKYVRKLAKNYGGED